jgi:hypothetical protein
MKVETKVLDIQSNLPGERIGMSIDEAAMAHIMSVLTNLYSDPEMAVLREYSTNAYDAHVEAGQSRPIEITLPTSLSPFLKIRDYGYGLDADDIREIYSRYGASTKRDSNDFNGTLGLGCKSALSYTDQFTLTGTKNGVTTVVSVSRNEDGGGTMTLVDQFETTDESGVEITIPVKLTEDYSGNLRANAVFAQKASALFRFWDPGTVLVNGEEPQRIEGFWISDDLLLTKDAEQDTVVMGNVPYPMNEDDDWSSRHKTWKRVSFVDIGSVNFTPSRESLHFNALTKDTLKLVKDRIETERDAAITKQISECVSFADALRLAVNSREMGFEGQDATYKGQPIPLRGYDFNPHAAIVADGVKNYRSKGWEKSKTVPASLIRDAIFLVGFDKDQFSPYQRQKLEQWFDNLGQDRPDNFVLIPSMPRVLKKWISSDRIMSWANGPQLEKVVREKVTVGSSWQQRVSGSYSGYVAGVKETSIEAKDIDVNEPIFWIRKSEDFPPRASNIVKHLYPNATIVQLGENRIKKFERDFPTAQRLYEFIRAARAEWVSKLTKDKQVWLHLYTSGSSELKDLDPSLIKDPRLSWTVSLAQSKRNNLWNEYQIYGDYGELDWDSPLERYPLLNNRYCRSGSATMMEEHKYIYINAVYAAERNQR